MTEQQDDAVERLVRLVEEAFEIAKRGRSLAAGDTLAVPVEIPGGEDAGRLQEALRQLARRGYTASQTTGISSFTLIRTNMPATSAAIDRDALTAITALLRQMVELHQSLLQKPSGLTKGEIIALTSLGWAILIGVLNLIAK